MANGEREKWRETHDHVVFLPFAFAVNVILNLSNANSLVIIFVEYCSAEYFLVGTAWFRISRKREMAFYRFLFQMIKTASLSFQTQLID